MTDTSDGKRDFFVSFNQADRAWATWIALTLKEAGYSVWFQDWDFKGSVAAAMQQGHRASTHTLAVLSESYLASKYCRAEWEMRFREDADGTLGLIVPLRVKPCEPDTLLGNLAWRDLFGLDEDAARSTLLTRARQAIDPNYRPGADERPRFSDASGPFTPTTKPRFPGSIHNLPPYNPDFIGREEVLVQLEELLSKGQGPAVITQAITGLGGIGKTQTALAYCYRHLAEHTVIWWLRAEQSTTLASQLAALAPHLGLDPATPGQDALLQSVRERLAEHGGFLLVFDNLEEPDVLPAFLPRTGGKVLITARQRDWQGRARTLPLDVMSEPEAVRLLTGAGEAGDLPEPRRSQAKMLAKELGHLPLALAQARIYMAATGETLEGYLGLLAESRPTMLAEGQPHPDYPATVAKTWDVSVRAARQECAAAPWLLELLAFFAPDPLPRTTLEADPDALPEELRGKLARNRAIAALTRFSLITADDETGTIAVHRLVQAVTRDGLDTATAKARTEAAVRLVLAALPRLPDEHTNWPAMGLLLPHALAAAEAAERLGAGLETAATVLNETATYHLARAAWAEAEALFLRGIVIGEKILGPDHPGLAPWLNNLASLYHKIGRYAEAEPLYQRALNINEKTLGLDHPEVAIDLSNLASLYKATGRYAAAEPLYQRALTIIAKALPPDHPNLVTVRENYAALLGQLGRTEEAAALRAQAAPPGPHEPGGPK